MFLNIIDNIGNRIINKDFSQIVKGVYDMAMTIEMFRKIKEEITNDPDNLGYAGKTDAEIAIILNSSIFKNRVVIDASPSPINRILRGMEDGPNFVSDVDVTQSKLT